MAVRTHLPLLLFSLLLVVIASPAGIASYGDPYLYPSVGMAYPDSDDAIPYTYPFDSPAESHGYYDYPYYPGGRWPIIYPSTQPRYAVLDEHDGTQTQDYVERIKSSYWVADRFGTGTYPSGVWGAAPYANIHWVAKCVGSYAWSEFDFFFWSPGDLVDVWHTTGCYEGGQTPPASWVTGCTGMGLNDWTNDQVGGLKTEAWGKSYSNYSTALLFVDEFFLEFHGISLTDTYFSGSPESGKKPLTVTFQSYSHAGYPDYINYWKWEFGDGVTFETADPDEGETVDHVYSTSGTYTVKLTVSNDWDTVSYTRTKYITVTN